MKILKFLFLALIILLIYQYRDYIIYQIMVMSVDNSNSIENSYTKEQKLGYVKLYDKEKLTSKEDIINAYYTILNNGYDTYTITCDSEYKDCMKDFNEISNDPSLLSHINNFVSPYNSFSTINSKSYNVANIEISPVKIYDDVSIAAINGAIDGIYKKIIKPDMTKREQIKAFHDYIINKTKYDSDRANNQSSKYDSNTAFGPLFQGMGICSGYSDAMALFLDKIGVENHRIASESHVWNHVNLDGVWYHLDLTWDDPILSSGANRLDDTYFLISTKELEKNDIEEHGIDTNIYMEAK